MLLFLYRLSGIPWTEAQSLRSRGEDYRRYQAQVSAFIPLTARQRAESGAIAHVIDRALRTRPGARRAHPLRHPPPVRASPAGRRRGRPEIAQLRQRLPAARAGNQPDRDRDPTAANAQH
jgi:hypothetical protein